MGAWNAWSVPAGRSAALLWLVLATGCGGGGSGGSNQTPADTTPPSVPQSVTATAQSSTQVHVTWKAWTDAGTGVAGYRIHRNGGAAPVATVTGTSYTDANLAPATQYSYTVRAFDGASPPNESAASAAGMSGGLVPAAAQNGVRAILDFPNPSDRVGSFHSVVFGGFTSVSLASRIDDAQPKVIVSADAGSRAGKVVPYKGLLDEAIRLSKSPPSKVLLMPEGTSVGVIRGLDETLVDLCKRTGYRYCNRLHV